MVRKAQAASITPGMYRHFAAVTVVATVMMAMISSGETREAVAQAAQPSAEGHPAEFVRSQEPVPRSFGTDDWVDAGFGQPTDRPGATASGVIPGEAPPPQAGMPVGHTVYGVSAEVWASLNPEQRKKLIEERQAAQSDAARPGRAGEIDALLAASRARSGAAAAAAD